MSKQTTKKHPTENAITPALMTIKEAAAYCGRTEQGWRILRSNPKGVVMPRYARIGGRVFYRQSDLDAWIEAHMVEPRKCPTVEEVLS